MANMALEVLSFLMLNQYLLVIEFAIAVITPNLGSNPLLLLPHGDSENDYDAARGLEVEVRGVQPPNAATAMKEEDDDLGL